MSAERIAEGEHRLEVCQCDAEAFLLPSGKKQLVMHQNRSWVKQAARFVRQLLVLLDDTADWMRAQLRYTSNGIPDGRTLHKRAVKSETSR